MASGDQQRLHDIVERVVRQAGYDLEDLTVVSAGRRRQVRVVIDRDGGVDLDDASEVSRTLSAELDGPAVAGAADPMGSSPYTLEVTSPGVGRPLTLPRHFRRSAGRLLAVTSTAGVTFEGRIRTADDTGVELLIGKRGTEPRWFGYQEIDRARVEVEFNRPSAEVLALLGPAAPTEIGEDLDLDLGDVDLDLDQPDPAEGEVDDLDDTGQDLDDTGQDLDEHDVDTADQNPATHGLDPVETVASDTTSEKEDRPQ